MKKFLSILIICLFIASCETSKEAYYREMTEKLKNGPELTICAPTLYFESNSYELSDEEIERLIQITKIMISDKDMMTIEIQGHTDNLENPDNHIELSLKRAQRVKEIIIQRGFPSYRFIVKGLGSEQPVDFNTTEQGRANNRRVDFRATKNTSN